MMSQVALFLCVTSRLRNINSRNNGKWYMVELKTDEKSKNITKVA